jgi:hypothetical protein
MSMSRSYTPAPTFTSTESTVVTLRPIGGPLPIGFLALAVGSFLFAGLRLHWISSSQGHAVAVCLVVFVVPRGALQLISAVFGLLARDVITRTSQQLNGVPISSILLPKPAFAARRDRTT